MQPLKYLATGNAQGSLCTLWLDPGFMIWGFK